jgi:hypothetical protein
VELYFQNEIHVYIVTCRPISRQRPNTLTEQQRSYCKKCFYVIRAMPIARQRVAKHIPVEAHARNNRTYIARQQLGKQALLTIQDVFSMGPPREHICSPVVNQKSVVEREQEWSESSAVKEKELGWRFIVSSCNWLWLREIVQEGVNKSNHPIQKPVIISHGAINTWQYYIYMAVLRTCIMHKLYTTPCAIFYTRCLYEKFHEVRFERRLEQKLYWTEA